MTTRPAVLLVDDEADLLESLAEYLIFRGFDVRTAPGGQAMRAVLEGFRPDVVVLDLQLRGESGFALAEWLDRHHRGAPAPGVLFLSGAAGLVDRVIGLELGADDFLEKPISPRALLARLNSLLRRLGKPVRDARLVTLGPVAIDPVAQTVVDAAGNENPLSPSEFALLKCFLDEPGRMFTRDDLLDRAPARDEAVADRAIDRRIARLRQKLKEWGASIDPIETVHGMGYRLASALDPSNR